MHFKDYLIEAIETKSLDISVFKLKARGITGFIPQWNKLTSLMSLNLSGNKIGLEGILALLPCLDKMTGMVSLNLGRNNLGSEGITVLSPSLDKMPGLVSLILCENIMGTEGINALTHSLDKLTTLTTLDISDNDFGLEGINALCHSLDKLTKLKSLYCRYNILNTVSIRVFFSQVVKMTWLTELDISGNKIGEEGVRALSPSLRLMTALKSINIGSNQFSVAAIKALAPNLNNMYALTSLDISWNSLGERGTLALISNTEKFTSLTSLNISTNGIGTKGIKAIGPYLNQLRSLNLRRSLFYNNGLKALAQQLTNLCSLTLLNLSVNNIENEGVIAFAPQLSNLTVLRLLDLSENSIGPEGLSALIPNLAKMTTLSSLNIDRNRIYGDVYKIFKIHVINMTALTSLNHDSYYERPELNTILNRNRIINLQLNNITQQIDTLNTNGCIQKNIIDKISQEIDELQTFTKEIENQHQVEPFALRDIQFKLHCRLALICKDFTAAMIFAKSMRLPPLELLIPYTHIVPTFFTYAIRASTAILDDPAKMLLLCELLINTNLVDIISITQEDLYRFTLMLAGLADPHGANKALNNMLQILNLFPNELKRRNSESNENLCRLLSFDQLIFNINCCYQEEIAYDEHSLAIKTLLDLLNVAKPYTPKKEKQLLDHSLVSAYFNSSKPIITYERLICESYKGNLIPQYIDDLIPEIRRNLTAIADQYEKNNTTEIGTIVNNNSPSISLTQRFFSNAAHDSSCSSEENLSTDHSNSF